VKNGTPRELALGHSRFDQSFPTALHEMEWVNLSIGEKGKDGVEKKIFKKKGQ
jgi:hypothetical protein